MPTRVRAWVLSALLAAVPISAVAVHHTGRPEADQRSVGDVARAEPAAAEEVVTREQVAAFVARAMEISRASLPAGPDAFSDDDASPFEDQIDALAAAGIVHGTEPGRYDPSALVTRAQTASIIARAYEYRLGSPAPRLDDVLPATAPASTTDAVPGAGALPAGQQVSAPPDRNGPVRRSQLAQALTRWLDLVAADSAAQATTSSRVP